MIPKKGRIKTMTPARGAVRATISFPPELYAKLEEIARQKKVSLAWVVRDAAERYVEEKWPLFPKLG
jgi:metal-responsive CopG/Arc/MetJ family transcriptional regulator